MAALVLVLFDHFWWLIIHASHWEYLTEGQIAAHKLSLTLYPWRRGRDFPSQRASPSHVQTQQPLPSLSCSFLPRNEAACTRQCKQCPFCSPIMLQKTNSQHITLQLSDAWADEMCCRWTLSIMEASKPYFAFSLDKIKSYRYQVCVFSHYRRVFTNAFSNRRILLKHGSTVQHTSI